MRQLCRAGLQSVASGVDVDGAVGTCGVPSRLTAFQATQKKDSAGPQDVGNDRTIESRDGPRGAMSQDGSLLRECKIRHHRVPPGTLASVPSLILSYVLKASAV